MESLTPVTILVVQILPVHKDKRKSMKKAENLISEFSEKNKIDIMILSEMVFTGYKFNDKEDIEPLLEEAGNGETFEWCASQAKRLGCWVFCGYAEKAGAEMTEYYNSQMVVSPDGTFVKSYKKHFLYETDKTWASEGPSFESMDIFLPRREKTITVGNGICMDINPYEFEAEYELMEFANFHKEKQVSLIMFSSAWTDPNTYPNDEKATNDTINYWANRLIPIIKDKTSTKPCYFVCSNRIGSELGISYMGSSCILQLKPTVGIVENLKRKEQNVILETIKV